MIPAVEVYPLHIGPVPIQPFGFLVCLGLVAGYQVARRRAPLCGVPRADLDSFVWWMLAPAFVMGHVLDEIFYHPDALSQPWTLLAIWDGQSSYGGFVGAVAGGVLWSFVERTPGVPFVRLRAERRPMLAVSDLVASVFPLGWMFGRAGCALVHDHLGVPATSALAVEFGAGPVTSYGLFAVHHGEAPRYDLGLLELFCTIAMAAVFAVMWRKKRPVGSYLVALCLAYPPVRFVLDFWRLGSDEGGDERYLRLTPAQWACFAFFLLGVWLWTRVRASARTGRGPSDALPE
jgi:phosphatidylglycerol---prolipoprotein diacylglyceryl transferase